MVYLYPRIRREVRIAALPERHIAEDVAEKVALDIDHWYDVDARLCAISHFEGLQHNVHERGAVISWLLE